MTKTKREQLAVTYIEDGLTVGANGADVWVRLVTEPYDLLTVQQRVAIVLRQYQGLASLREGEVHLLIVPHVYTAQEWAHRLDEITPRPNTGWPPYLLDQTDHMARSQLAEREVYLGVRLTQRTSTTTGPLRELLARAETAMGVRPPSQSTAQLQPLRDRAATITRTLRQHMDAEPATAAQLRWLLSRSMWRGIGEPPTPSTRPAYDGELLALVEGTIERAGPRTLRIEQPEGTAWLTSLGFARFPDELPFPGGEWLYSYLSLGFDLDASVRFQIVPPRVAAKDAQKKFETAADQANHIAEAGGMAPLELLETLETARNLEYAIKREQVPLIYARPRLTVWGSSEAELTDRVTELVEHYADMGVDLVRPAGDQVPLFLEALPGDRVRVPSYLQRAPVATLAGAGYVATSSLGDQLGPYIGYTTGRTLTPVHFDPHLAARRHKPTAITYTGQPGGGKTTTAYLHAYQMRLRGARGVIVDPKGDATGLADLKGMGEVRVVRLGDEHAGVLDPYRVQPDPRHAQTLAVEMCRQLLPLRLAEVCEPALLRAANRTSLLAKPSLLAMVRVLAEDPAPAAAEAHETLEALAGFPLAQLAFGDSDQAPIVDLAGLDALTILQLTDINLPDATSVASEYTATERMSVALMHGTAALTERLIQGDKRDPKFVLFDEAHALTGSAGGRATTTRVARMGRSRNTVLGLITQNAADLLDEGIKNNVSTRFIFASVDEDEITKLLKYADLADTEANRNTIKGLRNGECVMVDLWRRAGPIAIDLVLDTLHDAFQTAPELQTRVDADA